MERKNGAEKEYVVVAENGEGGFIEALGLKDKPFEKFGIAFGKEKYIMDITPSEFAELVRLFKTVIANEAKA